MLGLHGHAQSVPSQPVAVPSSVPASSVPALSGPALPRGAASTQSSARQAAPGGDLSDPAEPKPDGNIRGNIHGTVTDANGNVVVGALVTLTMDAHPAPPRTARTDSAGFFSFSGLPAGTFHIQVTSEGFTPWQGPGIVLSPGEYYQAPEIALQVASANTSVRVVFSRQQLAEEQVHQEEKQRVLGVFPNFYVSYVWNAEPLTPGQKFQLAWRSAIDPVTFAVSGVIAGIEQWQNDFSGYGQGSAGYAKRFGASYADGFLGIMIGGAILPSILHQDPRYYYKGTGSIRSRALYAISTVVITKGDNGHWQPNYSNVLGNIASAGISNLYYPSTDRNGAQVTIDNALLGTAAGAVSALLQEFVIRKVSRGVPLSPTVQP